MFCVSSSPADSSSGAVLVSFIYNQPIPEELRLSLTTGQVHALLIVLSFLTNDDPSIFQN